MAANVDDSSDDEDDDKKDKAAVAAAAKLAKAEGNASSLLPYLRSSTSKYQILSPNQRTLSI